jgi:AcrR family transcriptional regulator
MATRPAARGQEAAAADETPRTRDAERSREAIMAAAERLFAERGYDGASLQDIGAAAGLSRGTPSYFFGSKEQLYREVLQRAFARRHAATRAALEPVFAWCGEHAATGDDPDALRAALTAAARGYMEFLAAHPTFTGLVMREELDRGVRLRSLRATSTAMQDAFTAVQAVGPRRGLRAFDVDDAVFLFVALTFTAYSYEHTFMRALDRDISRPAARRRHLELAVDQLMHLLRG